MEFMSFGRERTRKVVNIVVLPEVVVAVVVAAEVETVVVAEVEGFEVAVRISEEAVVVVVVAGILGSRLSPNLSFWHGVNFVELIATLTRFLKITCTGKNIKNVEIQEELKKLACQNTRGSIGCCGLPMRGKKSNLKVSRFSLKNKG